MSHNDVVPGVSDKFTVRPCAASSDTDSSRIVVGDAVIQRIEEVRYKFPLSMFGLDEATLDRHWNWLFPALRIVIAIGIWWFKAGSLSSTIR